MADTNSFPLMAVDVGNSRVKFGEFEHPLADPLPHPQRALAVELDWTPADLEGFLPRDPASYSWRIASVNRPAATRLIEWLRERHVPRVQRLKHTDMPLEIHVPRPDQVGLDRLANAVAANRLRVAEQPAIVIDLGSAITVDLVSPSGAFNGGAILPGITISSQALHEFTDLLPLVEVTERPDALGTSTLAAIRSGLYWGMVGAVRELVARLSAGSPAAQVFLTGGAAPRFATALTLQSEVPPQFVPHLTLSGIALTALEGGPKKGMR
jgi:type III pantothenate kinase